ncbi:glycosyltransferase [Candidatus Altiarchaeota archaeon]
MSCRLSLLIPTYNESEIIADTLGKTMFALDHIGMDYEVWVADDGSQDGTVGEVNEFIRGLPDGRRSRVKIFEGVVNVGRGEVLHNAIPKSSGEIICFMDADLATDLSHLKQLVGDIGSGSDVATGSRWMPGSDVERRFSRSFISYFYNLFIRLVFGSSVRDHQCGFKSFRRDKIIQLLDETGVRENRLWAWDAEILVRAQKHGYSVSEFPVKWRSGRKSDFRYVRDITRIGLYLIGLYFRMKREY